MIPIAPDTQQNILYTIFFLFLHNGIAIFFAFGIAVSVIWALIKPSRSAVFSIVGFSLLLLGFEYNKHIVEPLIQQTQGSLITERQSYRLAWLIEKLLGRAMPIILYGGGLCSLLFSAILFRKEHPNFSFRKRNQSANTKKQNNV